MKFLLQLTELKELSEKNFVWVRKLPKKRMIDYCSTVPCTLQIVTVFNSPYVDQNS